MTTFQLFVVFIILFFTVILRSKNAFTSGREWERVGEGESGRGREKERETVKCVRTLMESEYCATSCTDVRWLRVCAIVCHSIDTVSTQVWRVLHFNSWTANSFIHLWPLPQKWSKRLIAFNSNVFALIWDNNWLNDCLYPSMISLLSLCLRLFSMQS